MGTFWEINLKASDFFYNVIKIQHSKMYKISY